MCMPLWRKRLTWSGCDSVLVRTRLCLRSRPWWLVIALMALIVIGFGLYEGLGFTRTGSVNLAGENAEVRSFALGAAFGAVALFGLGSHRAARTARQRRLSRADK